MQPDNPTHPLEDQLRQRLMPVSLSEDATFSIHSLLDELAAESQPPLPTQATPAAPTRRWLPLTTTAAAAAIAMLAAATALLTPAPEHTPPDQSTRALAADDHFAMRLVDESTRLSWVADGGWLDAPDGGTVHAVRIGVVEENRILDEETGIIVNVTSPREEMLLMPVSTF